MSDFLKGNFKPKKDVVDESTKDQDEGLEQKFRKAALNSIGGSMVYVERTALDWDGDE